MRIIKLEMDESTLLTKSLRESLKNLTDEGLDITPCDVLDVPYDYETKICSDEDGDMVLQLKGYALPNSVGSIVLELPLEEASTYVDIEVVMEDAGADTVVKQLIQNNWIILEDGEY